MDKKNLTIGIALMIAAFASTFLLPKLFPSLAPAPAPAPAVTAPAAAPADSTAGATGAPVAAAPAAVNPQNATFAAIAKDADGASVTTLANDFVEVRLTNFGGAVRDVAFRKRDAKDRLVYPETLGGKTPFVFNQVHADPMLAFVDFAGLDRNTSFQLVSASATEVVYRAVFENRLEVTRRYTLPDGSNPKTDPYQLRHETTFRNLTDQTLPLPKVALSLGTTSPISSHDLGHQLATGYSDGKDRHFFERSKLEGGGLLSSFGIGNRADLPFLASTGPVVWASVSNQFFTGLLTPDAPAAGLITRRVALASFADTPNRPNYGLTGAAQFEVPALAPNGSAKLGMNFYVGPKEYRRLSKSDVFAADQDKVMNFGLFRFFSQLLLTIMTWVHSWTEGLAPTWAWGWSIVITTLILKLVFLYPTLAASKTSKRMAKLQPEMQAIREKFKDNPQKLQAATMELFKKHRVNPMGGCLPILITMPFFFGFFQMLQSTAELRFAPFLWTHDLSAPDTVWHIPGINFPLNIMPLLMGATMIIQMRLTPTPTTDNVQAKIFKLMPWIFTVFCYTFSCALALYSTINGLFTIGQQLLVNRMKDEPLAPAPVAASGKPVKNVTPKKK